MHKYSKMYKQLESCLTEEHLLFSDAYLAANNLDFNNPIRNINSKCLHNRLTFNLQGHLFTFNPAIMTMETMELDGCSIILIDLLEDKLFSNGDASGGSIPKPGEVTCSPCTSVSNPWNTGGICCSKTDVAQAWINQDSCDTCPAAMAIALKEGFQGDYVIMNQVGTTGGPWQVQGAKCSTDGSVKPNLECFAKAAIDYNNSLCSNAKESLSPGEAGITYIFEKKDGWCGLPAIKECKNNPAGTPGYTCADDILEESCIKVMGSANAKVTNGCCMYDQKGSKKHFSLFCSQGYSGRAAIRHSEDQIYWGYAPSYYKEHLSDGTAICNSICKS